MTTKESASPTGVGTTVAACTTLLLTLLISACGGGGGGDTGERASADALPLSEQERCVETSEQNPLGCRFNPAPPGTSFAGEADGNQWTATYVDSSIETGGVENEIGNEESGLQVTATMEYTLDQGAEAVSVEAVRFPFAVQAHSAGTPGDWDDCGGDLPDRVEVAPGESVSVTSCRAGFGTDEGILILETGGVSVEPAAYLTFPEPADDPSG